MGSGRANNDARAVRRRAKIRGVILRAPLWIVLLGPVYAPPARCASREIRNPLRMFGHKANAPLGMPRARELRLSQQSSTEGVRKRYHDVRIGHPTRAYAPMRRASTLSASLMYNSLIAGMILVHWARR